MSRKESLIKRYNVLNKKAKNYQSLSSDEKTEITDIGMELSHLGYFDREPTFSVRRESGTIGSNPFMD